MEVKTTEITEEIPQMFPSTARSAWGEEEVAVTGCKGKMGKFVETCFQPNPDVNKVSCYRVFRSKEGINTEKRRHREQYPWIIHPFSIFRFYWDLILLVTLLITLVSLPVELAFFSALTNEGISEEDAVWTVIHIMADVVFVLDLIFNFRTGYVQSQTEEVILEPKKIALQYLKSWFVIDLISLDIISILPIWDDEGSATMQATMRLTRTLKMLRIFRVARFMRTIHKIEEILQVDTKVISMFNMVLIMVMFSHWNGCVQFFTAYVEHYPDFTPTSWVQRDNITVPGTAKWVRYTRSIFRAISQMIGIGFGLRPPVDVGETWTVIASMTLGATFYALFIAHMSSLIMSMDASGKKYEEKISEVKQYLRFRRVPLDIQQKVYDYFDHKYQRKYFDETSIFEENMSANVKRSIQLFNRKNLLKSVPFLASGSTEFLYDIICKLSHQIFFNGDTIMQAGKTGDCMYFLEHGRVKVTLPTGQVISTLTDGAYFGEISLLLDEKRTASVVAIETCDVYQLTKSDFDEVLNCHISMREALKDVAKQRFDELKRTHTALSQITGGPVAVPGDASPGAASPREASPRAASPIDTEPGGDALDVPDEYVINVNNSNMKKNN